MTKSKIIITLRSPKGAEHQMETTENKVQVVKRNARAWGYQIVKIEKVGA